MWNGCRQFKGWIVWPSLHKTVQRIVTICDVSKTVGNQRLARVTIILTTTKFHTMRMQNGTRILNYLRCDSTLKQTSNFAKITAEWSDAKFAEIHREYQRRNGTLDNDCWRLQNTRIHKDCKNGDCKELLKFRQRKLVAEARSSESDLDFSTIDASFHTRGNLDLILIYGRKKKTTR